MLMRRLDRRRGGAMEKIKSRFAEAACKYLSAGPFM